MKGFLPVFLFILVAFSSCKDTLDGQINENNPPESFMVADTIVRLGDNRMKTQIDINWWGSDPDGYVKAYEISFDKITWTYTEKQDSTFLVEIPEGLDTFDFAFYVRAIDNQDLRDPSPAHLYFPVKNSPPDVEIIYPGGTPARKPTYTFPVLKYSWNGTDPDGNENLDHYEIYLNDTLNNPVIVESDYSTVTLEANDLTGSTSACNVYMGSAMKLNSNEIEGLIYNDTNQFIIRAVDIVGEKSDFEYSYKIYVRKPESKVLLVNAYSNNYSYYENFYTNNLNAIGITDYQVTRVNEIENGQYTELAPDNVSQSLIFNYFDVIIWFGKEAGYSMTLAQRTTDEFFNQGGKMFMCVEIASNIEDQAGYLDFTPIDSLAVPPVGVNAFRIEKDSLINPVINDWPQLKSSRFISSARPFYEDVNSTPLYDAVIIQTGSFGKKLWTGKSTIMVKREVSGKTQFIISSVEIQNLNGNNNIEQLFEKIFKTEFDL